MPEDLDPHAFEPSPQDLARVADSTVLIVNGAGLEGWLQELLENAGGQRLVIEASAGLTPRQVSASEAAVMDEEIDPHFWLDPLSVVRYVENIRDGLSQADPQGSETYARNARDYIARLQDLDRRIRQEVSVIPAERRLIVTNHESFGYFADRYGFKVIGAIIPSVSTGAEPSARQVADLVDSIRQANASAIFLETGANSHLAEQISAETGIRVVDSLFTHSVTAPGGPAPTYLEMMLYNTRTIVDALK